VSRLRFGLHFEELPEREGAAADAYREILARACEAERLGFDAIRVGERGRSGRSLPAAFPLCAALAAVTRRVRIGIAVLPLPLHHPLRVAEDAATLDGLSGGRFELGVGLGGDPEDFQGYGVPPEERAGRLEEAIVVLDRALRGEPVEFAGRHFAFSGVRVVPAPVQPGGPRLWIGGRAAPALRRAVRLGRGLLAPDLASVRTYREAWRAERDPARLRVALRTGDEPASLVETARVLRREAEGAEWVELLLPAPRSGRPLPSLDALRGA
jgi:alkanesulfonate monooxygenase SsuD/methylene tetrahydromethanopterin reductase-like flavin-dependent oxidoreductase (luciferase family)